MPFALRCAVNDELQRLEREGELEKVDICDWATPLVVVPKKNCKVRLCRDYRITLNPVNGYRSVPLTLC